MSLVHSGSAVVPTAQAEKPAAHCVGHWALWNDAGYFTSEPDYEIAEILKVTAKMVMTTSRYSSREHRRYASDIIWSGPEEAAKALVEKLKSSVSLCKDERRKCLERQSARALDLIAKATGAPA